ncbi:MAG: hypothetical protein J5833_00920, partial [Victivallales bacterium]|nr:hypothetical protein [Victivallales bacterium]
MKIEIDARSASAQIDGELHPHIAAACGVSPDDIVSYRIEKRSLDARFKPLVKIVYQLTAEFRDGVTPKRHVLPVSVEELTIEYENR